MHDDTCVEFLQWCLPHLDMRWAGFRKVRGQVCKRIARRMQELRLRSTDEYRNYLQEHPGEWDVLDDFCRITISRFYRDRGVFDALRTELLPELAAHAQNRPGHTIRAWSAGCASGEEPYTVRLIWDLEVEHAFPDVALHIIATDSDEHMLHRADRARYPEGSLKHLPKGLKDKAFEYVGGEEPYQLRPAFREGITWYHRDIRQEMPNGPFDLICCRNLVFMYFSHPLQRACLRRIEDRLRPGGLLVLGKHDHLPDGGSNLIMLNDHKRIYRRKARDADSTYMHQRH